MALSSAPRWSSVTEERHLPCEVSRSSPSPSRGCCACQRTSGRRPWHRIGDRDFRHGRGDRTITAFGTITVKAGDSIEWVKDDTLPHAWIERSRFEFRSRFSPHADPGAVAPSEPAAVDSADGLHPNSAGRVPRSMESDLGRAPFSDRHGMHSGFTGSEGSMGSTGSGVRRVRGFESCGPRGLLGSPTKLEQAARSSGYRLETVSVAWYRGRTYEPAEPNLSNRLSNRRTPEPIEPTRYRHSPRRQRISSTIARVRDVARATRSRQGRRAGASWRARRRVAAAGAGRATAC